LELRTTRQKETSGYTTLGGTVKQWLVTGLELANAASLSSNGFVPLVDTPSLKSFAVALENDGTTIKPGIEYDEQQQINVGIQGRADLAFVKGNPNPTSEFLRSNVVTEANVSYLSTLDNEVNVPVGVRFVPKSGKTGENMKAQFLEDIVILPTSLRCLKDTKTPEYVIPDKEAVAHCKSKCDACLEEGAVCQHCQYFQPSHLPPLRACERCLNAGVQCIRACVLVLTTDCESGNKTAFELIIHDHESGLSAPDHVFACIPDAVHVGKSLKKVSFTNWMILLNGERACLSMLHCLRDEDPSLRKILSRDAVLNKEWMWTVSFISQKMQYWKSCRKLVGWYIQFCRTVIRLLTATEVVCTHIRLQ